MVDSMREHIEKALEDINNFMAKEHCSGYPYLKLQSKDYRVKNYKNAYEDYLDRIKRLGFSNSWSSNKSSFFDIHPVFSNAVAIPSFMGFHLSLIIYDKGLSSSTETLYFDTLSNWEKFTRVTDKRAFNVCSWLRYDQLDGEPDEDQDDDADRFKYLPINIALLKGVELSNPDKQAPIAHDQQLVAWYKKQAKPVEGLRSILLLELDIFQSAIANTLQSDSGKLTSAAKYLFALIFCREYGIKNDIFVSVIDELNIKFNFSDDADIVKYSLLCFSHLDKVKIRIGQYAAADLNHEQIDISLNAPDVESNDLAPGDKEDEQEPKDGDGFVLKENLKNQNYSLNTRFHQMQPALDDERLCRIEIYRIWKELVLCFYGLELTQDVYNKLRNIMDTYVGDAILSYQLLNYKNLDTQMVALKNAAFDIYQKSIYDYDVIVTNNSLLANNLFDQLKKPELTQDEQNSLNLLNSKAQVEFRASIIETYLADLVQLLSLISSKFAHSQYNNLRGDRLKNIDLSTFKKMVMNWYKTNYIESYLALNNDYFFIKSKIQNDLDQFSKDPFCQTAILNEISSFVRSDCNPFVLIDLSS